MNAPTSSGGTARRSRAGFLGRSRGSCGLTRNARAGFASMTSSSTASESIADNELNALSIVVFASPRANSFAITSRSIERSNSCSGKLPLRGRYGST
jgi:hypothetical protein